MPLQVLASPRADQQQRTLRRKDRALFDQFVDDLARRGCAALSYRLTFEIENDAVWTSGSLRSPSS